MTDDAKLLAVLLESGLAETASSVGRDAGVDPAYAEQALARMADEINPDPPYPIVRRFDLGPDVYEAVQPDDGAGES